MTTLLIPQCFRTREHPTEPITTRVETPWLMLIYCALRLLPTPMSLADVGIGCYRCFDITTRRSETVRGCRSRW